MDGSYDELLSLPVHPLTDATGQWLCVSLELPGRMLRIYVWKV